MKSHLTPTSPLAEDETMVQSFRADRETYVRANALLAAGATAGGSAVLFFMGNPDIWAGAIGGLTAVAVRAFYLMSDEMGARWDLTTQRLMGPQERIMGLHSIKTVRAMGSVVQVITHSGDKHLIKYQSNTDATIQAIQNAMAEATT